MDGIMYEKGPYYVIEAKRVGYEIYKNSTTHAYRVAQIGYAGDKGLSRCKEEIERRLNANHPKKS